MRPAGRVSVRAVPSVDTAQLRRETRERALRARREQIYGAKRLMPNTSGPMGVSAPSVVGGIQDDVQSYSEAKLTEADAGVVIGWVGAIGGGGSADERAESLSRLRDALCGESAWLACCREYAEAVDAQASGLPGDGSVEPVSPVAAIAECALGAGIVAALGRILEDPSAGGDVPEALWCIANLTAAPERLSSQALPLVPYISPHCVSEAVAVAERAAWSIGNLAGGHIASRDAVRKNGAVVPLARLVAAACGTEDQGTSVFAGVTGLATRESCAAVTRVAREALGDTSIAEVVLEDGGAPGARRRYLSAARTACWALVNCARGPHPRVMRLAAQGCAEVGLRAIVCSNDLRLAIDASWLVAAIVSPPPSIGSTGQGCDGNSGGIGDVGNSDRCAKNGGFGANSDGDMCAKNGGFGTNGDGDMCANDDVCAAPTAAAVRDGHHMRLAESMCAAGLVRGLSAKSAQGQALVVTPIARCMGHLLSYDSPQVLQAVVRDWPLGRALRDGTPGPSFAQTLSEWLLAPLPVSREAAHIAQVLAGGAGVSRDYLVSSDNGVILHTLASVLVGGDDDCGGINGKTNSETSGVFNGKTGVDGTALTRAECLFALLNLAADPRHTGVVVASPGLLQAVSGDIFCAGLGPDVDRAALLFMECAVCEGGFAAAQAIDETCARRVEELAVAQGNERLSGLAARVADLISAAMEDAQ